MDGRHPATALSRLTPWLVPAAIAAGWQAAASAGLVSTRFMPAPSDVLAAGFRLAASGELLTHVQVSFARALTGFRGRRRRSASRSASRTACRP